MHIHVFYEVFLTFIHIFAFYVDLPQLHFVHILAFYVHSLHRMTSEPSIWMTVVAMETKITFQTNI